MAEIKCMNPWDPQAIRQYDIEGIHPALQSNSGGGQNRSGICYAIEGNVVDRMSTKNGKGWCADVSPTLNTQDRHAVVYALEGNGARPSHMGVGYSDNGKMYTLNTIEQHSVCYAIENHAMDSRVTLTTDGIVQTMNARMGTGGGNVPLVLMRNENESTSDNNRCAVREQPSGELHRTGRVQRHAAGNQEE